VIVDGQTAVSAGANVSGTVVRAKPAGHLAGEASLVLRLTSVHINHADQPVVTAARSFGPKIKSESQVKKFCGGLATPGMKKRWFSQPSRHTHSR
jgi:hypothetical protein